MEFAETLGRIAQNYGPGAAAVAAVGIVAFRVFFSKYFDKKKADVPTAATREDIDQLRQQLDATLRQLDSLRMQLARVDWLAQQQWLHGRCVGRSAIVGAKGGHGSQKT